MQLSSVSQAILGSLKDLYGTQVDSFTLVTKSKTRFFVSIRTGAVRFSSRPVIQMAALLTEITNW